MPANLTPEYLKAEEEYRQAKTPEEKLEALRAMLAAIPKHKGTEKMQADIKRKISQANKELQKAGKKKSSISYIIKREGAGQVCLIGTANSGKSTLLASITNANPSISDIPFTTKTPYPGMMPYQNIYVQIIDLPPINSYYRLYWLYEIAKKADLLILVVDTSRDDIIEQISFIKDDLAKANIQLSTSGNNAPMQNKFAKKCILAATKMDLPASKEHLPILLELFEKEFLIIPISAKENKNLDALKAAIFDNLNIVRIFSKPPGKPVDLTQPFIFPKGATVLDMAEAIHKEFREKLKYARLWQKNNNINGIRIPKDYLLQDGDIIEIHI